MEASFVMCPHCGIGENHKLGCPKHQASPGFQQVNPFRKYVTETAKAPSTPPSDPIVLPVKSREHLSRKRIDRIVYLCREDGKDTTYDIVNTAIEFFLHGSGNNSTRGERLKALEDIAAMATVGATYPELMQYLQAEIQKAEDIEAYEKCPYCGIRCATPCDSPPPGPCEQACNAMYGADPTKPRKPTGE